VVIGARDRKGLERLCRYIARPPLAKSRLETRQDGTVVIRLKQPWADGTGAIQLSRLELMERLAALVPPPRKNQVRTRCGAARCAGIPCGLERRDRAPASAQTQVRP
jgi:hypothetical protein